MLSKSNIVTLLFSLTLCFKYASSIFCYDCNSAYDPRCGEEFDSFSLGVVNCSLRDPPEHITPVEPTFCRVIKMEIYGKIRILRQCGYIQEETGGHTCKRQTGNGEVYITYCTCDTDLCNGSPKHQATFLTILSGIFTLKYVL